MSRTRAFLMLFLAWLLALSFAQTAIAAPNPISVSPNSVPNTGTQMLTITGTGFDPASTVKLTKSGQTDIAGTGLSVTLSVQISGQFNVTAAAPGTWNVVVTNPDTTSGTCANCLTITASAPTVSSASPNSRAQGTANQDIDITGTNFAHGAVSSFSGTGIAVNSTTWVSTTHVTANITLDAAATLGARNITVTNTDAQAGSCTGCFTVVAGPTPTSVAPPALPNTGPGSLTITGTGFQTGATVLLRRTGQSDIPGTGVVVTPPTSMTANFNLTNAAPGPWAVRVTNPDGGVGTCSCFTVGGATPTVTGVVPTSRGQGATDQDLTVSGTNFAQGAVASFSGSGITVNSTTFDSPTQLTVNIDVGSGATTGLRDVIVTNTDTLAGTCADCFTVNAGPTVTSAAPSSRGQGATNQDIEITGTNFVSGAGLAASFSGTGIIVNSTTWNTALKVTANISVASGAAVGTRNITVTNPDAGAGSCSACFTVNAGPTVTSATPSSRGQGATNEVISIVGTNFVNGAGLVASFSGTGITVNSTTWVNATHINADITIAPTATTGSRNVTVTNPDGGAGSCLACFTVNGSPTVTSADPDSRGQGAADEDITITGTGFLDGASVSFSGAGITVNSTTFVSATELTANIDVDGAATPGARDVIVDNENGGSTASCVECFTVNESPTVTSATPDEAGQGATSLDVDLVGTGFTIDSVASFSGTGITVNSTTFDDDTHITANITVSSSAATGARTISVDNGDGGTPGTCACFTVNTGPTVTSTAPTAASNSGSVELTINGTGFVAGLDVRLQKTGQADIVGTAINTLTPTSFKATFNLTSAAPGGWDVRVTNADSGTGVCAACFTVASSAPTVTSATPASRGQGATDEDIVIAGTNFANGAVVSFSGTGITVNSTTFNSSIQLTVNIDVTSGATPGARNVTVTNTDTQAGTCTGCFTVHAKPTVTSASPSSRTQGATNQNITITGTNFLTDAAATFSGTGITVNSTTFVSATTLTANIDIAPNAATTARDVTVTNPDGGTPGVCTGCFTVLAPTLTGVSPSSRGQGATNQNLTLTGTGFLSGAVATFSGTGITVNSTTFVSSTTLTVNIDIAPNAATTARDVTVTNPGGGTPAVCTGCFTVLAPTVTGVSPSSRGRGATNQNLTVTGTGFLSGAVATFSGSGITVNSTTFVSSTTLTVNVDVGSGAPTGARNVTVTNPGGGTPATCTGCFTVTAAPIVNSAFPDYAARGASQRSITITGSGFDVGTTISFSGTGITVNSLTRNSSSLLTVKISVTANAATGLRSIKVTDSHAGTSTCVACFTVIRFGDVTPGNFAFDAIETIAAEGITGGCSTSPPLYCPDSNVTRGQMAVFLLRAMGHGDPSHLPAYRGIFADVPSSNPLARYIEHLYDHGITGGCATSPLRYCPSDPVTRGQMAVFLLRAIGHGSSSHLGSYKGTFADVPSSNPYARFIEHLYSPHGVTSGCATNPLRYCPNADVTRAQMAIFIVRTFGL